MARRRLLVPEARQALQSLKHDVVQEKLRQGDLPSPGFVKPEERQMISCEIDKGALTTRETGKVGGPVGGEMVRRLIEIAKNELNQRE